jgi:hypothetical protein
VGLLTWQTLGRAAWEEAEATAPPGVTIYATLELQHPSFLDVSSVNIPIRCVTGVADDMSFGIEGGGLFGGGTMQLFQAVPFYAERPEFSEGKAPECQVTIDNIGREVLQYLEAAVSVKADLVVLYREYRSDDLTTPCYGPIKFVMRKVRVTGTTVVGTARLDDLANRRFPYKSYTVSEFPGLVA